MCRIEQENEMNEKTKSAHRVRIYLRLCTCGKCDPEKLLREEPVFEGMRPAGKDLETEVNCEYDADINNMIRKTIKRYVGKEEDMRKTLDRTGAELYLVIVADIAKDSDEPYPMLSLDDDVIGFLYRSGAKEDLDYYIV